MATLPETQGSKGHNFIYHLQGNGHRMGIFKPFFDEQSKNKNISLTHKGLHRIDRNRLEPVGPSGILVRKVRSDLADLRGVTNVHDNIMVYEKDYEDHHNNSEAVDMLNLEVSSNH